MILNRLLMTHLELSVWGAAYVRVLSTMGPNADHSTDAVAGILRDPNMTERIRAEEAADGCVLGMRKT